MVAGKPAFANNFGGSEDGEAPELLASAGFGVRLELPGHYSPWYNETPAPVVRGLVRRLGEFRGPGPDR